MTNQIKDRVCLKEQDYSLLGRGSGLLFEPEEHGLEPLPLGSVNYRGFSCRYAIRENSLFLDEVDAHVFLEGRLTENAPALFGKTAEVSWMDDRLKAGGFSPSLIAQQDSRMALVLYRDIGANIAYTGGLLLGNDWADDVPPLPRFHHPACYHSDVREVILHEGRVTQEYNHSSAIAVIRQILREMAKGEVSNQREQISEQIKRCLSLAYDYQY